MENSKVNHIESNDKTYRYTECGLDNVIIKGVKFAIDVQGEQVLSIPAINCLHKTIALGIVSRDKSMSGKELRFLRTELGLTQAQLGRVLHHDSQTVARWEKDQMSIKKTAEILIRIFAIEKLQLDVALCSIEEMSSRCLHRDGDTKIIIDGSNRTAYRLIAPVVPAASASELPKDGGGGGGLNLDQLLVASLEKIPPVGDEWPKDQRVRWFRTFAMNVSQIYDMRGEVVDLMITGETYARSVPCETLCDKEEPGKSESAEYLKVVHP